MKIYKIKVNGKTYRVELENIEEVSSDPVKETVETNKSETKKELMHICLSSFYFNFQIDYYIIENKIYSF